MQRAREAPVNFKAFGEGALQQLRSDEQSRTGAIRIGLKLARPLVRTAFHNGGVTTLEECCQFIEAAW